MVRRHFQLLLEHFGESERAAILRMRKFGSWYATGFYGAAEFRRRFNTVNSGEELEEILGLWLEGQAAGKSRSPESFTTRWCWVTRGRWPR